jgi:hypothetical protein
MRAAKLALEKARICSILKKVNKLQEDFFSWTVPHTHGKGESEPHSPGRRFQEQKADRGGIAGAATAKAAQKS